MTVGSLANSKTGSEDCVVMVRKCCCQIMADVLLQELPEEHELRDASLGL